MRRLDCHLSEQQTQRLGEVAKRQRVTLNTMVRTCWGILLGSLRKVDDVVFGAVVSGRPPDLPDVEKMVGLFINTVPVRLTIARDQSFHEMLRHLQAQAFASEAYHYCSLADIQAATPLKQGLIDNVLVFENYPLLEEIQHLCEVYDPEITIGQLEEHDQTNYDLAVVVYPGTRLQFQMHYQALVYSDAVMHDVRDRLVRLLNAVIETPEIKLADLYSRLMNDDERREQEAFLSRSLEVSEDF